TVKEHLNSKKQALITLQEFQRKDQQEKDQTLQLLTNELEQKLKKLKNLSEKLNWTSEEFKSKWSPFERTLNEKEIQLSNDLKEKRRQKSNDLDGLKEERKKL